MADLTPIVKARTVLDVLAINQLKSALQGVTA
jgi:hypothetical protein